MEGTTKAIAGFFSPQRVFAALLFSLFFFPLKAGSASERSVAFLVIERPGSVVMYNQYQQRLSPSEQAQMIAFLPMQILEEPAFLSDGFTPCTKVEIEGKLFYVQTDQRGTPVSLSGTGFFRRYRNVLRFDDSVKVLFPGMVTFTSAGGKRSQLQRNVLLRRYFVDRSLTYVRCLDNDSSFGWVQLDPRTENSLWSVVKPVVGRGIPTSVLDKVEGCLREVNRHLGALFDRFRRESGRPLPVPEWQAGIEGGVLVCTLSRDSSAHAFAESTRLIAKDIEGFLIGTDLTMTVLPRRIEIRRR